METALSITAEPKAAWFEPVTVMVMAMSSLCTAWCSYQSSRWSGQSSGLANRAEKLERRADEQYLASRQLESIQVWAWMQAMDAQLHGDEKKLRFYTERFRGELKDASDKWMALNPLENPAAPPHPFVAELYTPPNADEIRAAGTKAMQMDAESHTASHTAASYLSKTVLFATVLFFAGTAGKFDHRRVRSFCLAFAGALFIYAVVHMALLPVA